MRLNKNVAEQIKKAFDKVFPKGTLYLFGSRTDNNQKGGDIDLFIEVEDKSNLFEKKVRFLAQVKKAIGDQRIDVIFNEEDTRLIEQEARKCAIRL